MESKGEERLKVKCREGSVKMEERELKDEWRNIGSGKMMLESQEVTLFWNKYT